MLLNGFFMFYNQMISVIVYDLMIHFIVDMGDTL